MTKGPKLAGAGLVGGLAVAGFAAWMLLSGDPYAAQDNCAFGAVSNESYRAMLAEARVLVEDERRAWIFHVRSRDIGAGSALLRRQQQALFAGRNTIPEQVAAMHALARAYGAQFARTIPDTATPWTADPATAPVEIAYVYGLNTRRIGYWQPLRQWTTLTGKFAVGDIGPGFEVARGMEAGTLLMYVTGSGLTPQIAAPQRSRFHECPPVPDAAWIDAFTASEDTTPAYEPDGTNVDLLVRLADGLPARGRVRLALKHLESALDLADRTLPADNETTIGILERLVGVYRTVGQPQRAAATWGRALDSRIRLGLPPRLVQ